MCNKTKFAQNLPFIKILLISLCFAILEYVIKIPAIYYFGKQLNVVVIYSYMLATIFICLIFFNKYILKEKIQRVTYISLLLIILILIFNNYMNSK